MATTAYRAASYGNPLRTVPSRTPGRFHTGDEESPTQYLCLHPLGPLAELMRNHGLREETQLREVRVRTWAVRVELDDLAEIGFGDAAGLGIEPDELVADDHSACRRLGADLRARVAGVVVPSAALPGTRNVVLFGPRVRSPYLLPPVSAVDVPASITAEGARPPGSLVERVRFRGDPNPELEAWGRSEPFEFEEPVWSVPESRRS